MKKMFLMLALMTGGCSNPMAPIEGDIAAFEQTKSSNFFTIQGRHRVVHGALAGDDHLRPLLFIHGSPGSWKAWAHFLRNANLTRRFQIFAVDRPGYGGSGAGVPEESLARQAEDIMEILQQNKSGLSALVIGHSMGGPVASALAMEFPRKVGGLILVASSVAPNLERTKWFQMPALYPPFSWILPQDLATCNKEILALKPELERIEEGWQKLQIPIAIIHGEEDDLVSPANVDYLLSRLDSHSVVSVTRVEGLNHFIPWKRPDLILNAIDAIDQKLAPKNSLKL